MVPLLNDKKQNEYLNTIMNKKVSIRISDKTLKEAQWINYYSSPTRKLKRSNHYEGNKSKNKTLRFIGKKFNITSLRENLLAKLNTTHLISSRKTQLTIARIKLPSISINVNAKEKKVRFDVSEFMETKTIGIGCYAEVKLAHWKTHNKPCVLKIVNKKVAVKHRQVNKLLREHQLMSNIKHPFIIQ